MNSNANTTNPESIPTSNYVNIAMGIVFGYVCVVALIFWWIHDCVCGDYGHDRSDSEAEEEPDLGPNSAQGPPQQSGNGPSNGNRIENNNEGTASRALGN